MTKPDVMHDLLAMNLVTNDEAERTLTQDEWQAMFDEIVSNERSLTPTRRLRWKRPALSAPRTAALLASALALAIAIPTLWPDAPGGASPAAADALHRAADAAASQAALPAPGPGQYLYIATQERGTSMYVPGHGQSNFLFTESSDVESWKSSDGSGRSVTKPTGVTFPTPSDRATWESAGEPNLGASRGDQRSSQGELYTIDLSEVPTDPEELLAAIERREILGGDPADWVTFQIIGELLQLSYGSPEHRAALYEVAANFPGVDFQGDVTDPAGRRGVAVSFDGGGHRVELIFDPETAELLGERQILLDQAEAGVEVGPDTWPGTIIAFAGPPGTVVYWRLFMETAVVDSTDDRP